MKLTLNIELDDAEEAALQKRVTGNDSPETRAETIVRGQIKQWADADFSAVAEQLVQKLKVAPKDAREAAVEFISKL